MHSLPFIKRQASTTIRRRFINHRNYTSPQSSKKSDSPILSPSTVVFDDGEGNNGRKSRLDDGSLLKRFSSSLSGILIVGSAGFGLSYYWSVLSDDTSSSSSWVAYADQAAAPNDYQDPCAGLQDPGLKKETKYLFGDDYRRRVFFNYEKRIRLTSPPEKVFEYFASIRTENGEVFMTPGDLMRAVVPVFPPSESNCVRGGHLKGERPPGELQCAPSEFFMLFDVNGDGLISFAEYIFLVTLLSIPESSFSVAFKMFDLDHNGEIDMDEFKKVMTLMRTYNRQGRQHRDGRRFGHNKVSSGLVENGGLIQYFFGKDGKTALRHETFVQFLRDLHDEITRLEFAHYDHKLRGTISAKDFGLSMVASADMSHTSKFLDRVEELNKNPHLKDVRVTYEEFKKFAELRNSLRPLALAIFSHGKVNGLLTKEDFQRAASHVCGISLTQNVIDIIFHVFDTNGDGSLSSDEFLRVLQRRGRGSSMPSGLGGLFSCFFDCASNRSSNKLLV